VSHVLILGAKSDIGKAIASQYAAHGYSLYLAARNVTEMKSLAKDLEIRHQQEIELIEFDAENMGAHEELYQSLSPTPIGVICVVGYLGDQEKAQSDSEELNQITKVNYTGCASILSVAANQLEEIGEGFIVGVTSVAGDRGRKSNYFYGSSKAALTVFLSGLRNRLSDKGVTVLTVKPGFVNTKMTELLNLPKKLTAEPQDVAKSVFKAQQANKDVIYVKSIWRWIMLLIKIMPEMLFKKTSL